MNYKCSICHPNKSKIEYPNEILGENQVIDLVQSYPWVEKLDLLNSLKNDEICYSPSLDFVNNSNKYSFGLTASLENGELEFSLWYKRMIKTKLFFGLLGEKEKMKVIDKWGFKKDVALEYLQLFLNKNFLKLEKLMSK